MLCCVAPADRLLFVALTTIHDSFVNKMKCIMDLPFQHIIHVAKRRMTSPRSDSACYRLFSSQPN